MTIPGFTAELTLQRYIGDSISSYIGRVSIESDTSVKSMYVIQASIMTCACDDQCCCCGPQGSPDCTMICSWDF